MTSPTPSTKREELREALINCAVDEDGAEYLVESETIDRMLEVVDQYARAICEEVIEDATNIDNTNCGVDHLDGDGCTIEDHYYRSGRFDAAREIEDRAEVKLNELIPKGEE